MDCIFEFMNYLSVVLSDFLADGFRFQSISGEYWAHHVLQRGEGVHARKPWGRVHHQPTVAVEVVQRADNGQTYLQADTIHLESERKRVFRVSK